MARRNQDFQTIRSEGGLLPHDLLRRLLDPKEKLPGTRPEEYQLSHGERLNEVISQSWNRLVKQWAEFRTAAEKLPAGEPATGLTNDKWTLPLLRELGFGLLPTTPSPEIGGRAYAINRFFGAVPVHLVGCGVSLDRRMAGVRGAAAANPHGLVQEFLNRSNSHLWAVISNGLRLRILRDSQALSRQSFLEFDLEAMFSGEVYPDFALLWMLLHATRFAPREENRPESCWLEHWTTLAEEQGTRALGDLRGGVERALQILGEGFSSHPRNTQLRENLRTGKLSLTGFHSQLLRVVYRLIFLFVAEDRTIDGHPVLFPGNGSGNMDKDAEKHYALFQQHYSTARLRDLASRIKGSRHGDLWQQFNLVVGALSGEEPFASIRQKLGLPALGSFLWAPASTSSLNAATLNGPGNTGLTDVELTNFDFLEALRNLAFTRQGKVLRPADYKNLGAEELGGIYESLLGLTPQISTDGARFYFAEFAGNERKTSGSYYTPDSLVQCLLDTTVTPVVESRLEEAMEMAGRQWKEVQGRARKTFIDYAQRQPPTQAGTASQDAQPKFNSGAIESLWKVTSQADRYSLLAVHAVLDLRVCDPACGSGHFLVGAAHRLARHLSRVRAMTQGESEPSPLLYQQALRDVIGRCLYGVDISPMAAELCRVSLWLEAMEPGKPLTFLEHHIRVGNSLLGATPELLSEGIPDKAFQPLEGDEKSHATALGKKNQAEKKGYTGLFGASYTTAMEARAIYGSELSECRALDGLGDGTWAEVRQKESHYRSRLDSEDFRLARQLADAWCAAFVWHKSKTGMDGKPVPLAPTQDVFRLLREDPERVPPSTREEIARLARQYRYFHWHLEFPQVFLAEETLEPSTDSSSSHGFDVILGNPPWERVKLQEKEFFAEHSREIANAPNAAARKRLIDALIKENPELHRKFQQAVRQAEGESHFLRNSTRYPLCGRGDINLYAVFGEAGRRLLEPSGRMGMVLPSGIASDDTTKLYFQNVVDSGSLVSLFDFENKNIFPEVHSSYKFCLFTAGSGKQVPAGRYPGEAAEFVFFAHSVDDLRDPERRFSLSADDIALLNPNTRTCPIFRSRRDAELAKAIYRRFSILVAKDTRINNLWNISLSEMFHMTNDSDLFHFQDAFVSLNPEMGYIVNNANKVYVPLYEGKMVDYYDHRMASVVINPSNPFRPGGTEISKDSQKFNPHYSVRPRYWICKTILESRIPIEICFFSFFP